jgi:hypothetical protein
MRLSARYGELTMQVNIKDDPANWAKWGALVRSWIFGAAPLPNDTAGMQAQMTANGIQGSVPGPVRGVTFIPYNDGEPLIFPLPTQAQVLASEAQLAAIAGNPPGQRHYPVPSFYEAAFGCAPEVDMGKNEMLDFGKCRLGEYTIQLCM